jgi:hypothetical protein
LDHGVALYLVRNEQGAEIIVRHHEIGKHERWEPERN